jgi:murein DD-endopeptidase MepM/ murein hydrolase activator NlpD
MSVETKKPGEKYSDDSLDPSQEDYDRKFNDIASGQESAGSTEKSLQDREFDQIARNYDKTADDSKEESTIEKLRKQEAEKVQANGPEVDGVGYKKESRFALFKSNRKSLMRLGVGGSIITLLVSGFFALIPLKLEMLIKTATQNAAAIPEHAIEHRIEYLTRQYIIMKITGTLSDTTDIDVGKGGLASSLFNTWRAAKYENALGLEIKSDRIRPGETAFKWEIREKSTGKSLASGNDFNETNIDRTIVGSKNMRKFIKEEVKEKTKWYQFYKRYAMRKTLMRTKGVARWSWLPNSVAEKMDNYAEKKRTLMREFKTNQYKNTIGRVAPRTMLYIGCLTNADACAELKNSRFGTTIEPDPDCTGLTEAQCADFKQRYADADKNLSDSADRINQDLDATIDKAVDMDGTSSEVSKWFSKQLLAKVAGGVGILDMIFRIIDSIDNGGINQVVYDRNSIMAVGYAAEMQAILAQSKEGKLTTAQFDAMMTQLGDFGASPAWQQEVGIIGSTVDKRFERRCQTSDTERGTLVLEMGDTVCPERKIIMDFTAFTKTNEFWGGLAQLAEWYKNSIGRIFDLFNAVVGFLQIDKVIGWIMETSGLSNLIGLVVETLFNMVFGAPVSGSDSGPEAGDNVLGGTKASYFALGEAGQDTDESGVPNGGGLGIGGAVMTPTATKELKSKIAAEKRDEFESKSFFAKMFDTSETQSVVSQLAIRTPTSTRELASLPAVIHASFLSIVSPRLMAAGDQKDQFGFDFGYGYGDAELVADPAKYNETTCVEYAKAREESYTSPENSNYPIYVYTKTDPCALEKVVVASGKAMFTTETDPDFQLGAPSTGITTPGVPDAPATPGTWVHPIANGTRVSSPYLARTRFGVHKGVDFGVGAGTKVYAATSGTILNTRATRNDPACARYITFKADAKTSDGQDIYINYQHLSPTERPLPTGRVAANQQIGVLATDSQLSSSCASGPHLHFQMQTISTIIGPLDNRASLTLNPFNYIPR